MKPIVVGAGKVECVLCPVKNNEKDGIALDVDGVEQQFCQKHFWSMLNMWRNAWAQRDQLPDPPSEIRINGDRSLMGG